MRLGHSYRFCTTIGRRLGGKIKVHPGEAYFGSSGGIALAEIRKGGNLAATAHLTDMLEIQWKKCNPAKLPAAAICP